ncbi:CDP-diacylglycerol--glycerol-3-phosphate 3-phosphatidyltransferase [Mactra antiquata]
MAASMRSFLMSRRMFDSVACCMRFQRHLPVVLGAIFLSKRNLHCVAASEDMSTHKQTKHVKVESLEKKFGWFSNHVPCFGVNGDNITVINEPCDFYTKYKNMVKCAKNRILIASLYLGTGSLESDLVQCIEEACERSVQNKNDNFEVHILLDYTRGSRGANQSSRTMLLPLLEKYGDRVHVYLYHTPDLRGLLKRFLPERFNEIVGLNHMKIYLADDDFIISGANLSDNYFTNRQDRYIQFRSCPEMSSYFCDLILAVSTFSFHLQCNNTTIYPHGVPHPYDGSEEIKVFKNFAETTVSNLNKFWKDSQHKTHISENSSDIDTWLYPLIQMGPFNIKDDEKVMEKLLKTSEHSDRMYLASGYFNLTSQYVNFIVDDSNAEFDILTASPETNGFFGASGISGFIPVAYTYIAKQFYARTCSQNEDNRITLYEYYRPDWTFHGKGLWYYISGSTLPVLTLIGSPNFGYRSLYRDLECQVAVVTSNSSLQEQLQEEHKKLYNSSYKVSSETFEQDKRYVPTWVRFVTRFIKNFF